MSEFKELILRLRNEPENIQKIYEYVKSDPVKMSQLPDDSYVINDGNHRANLLNLLNVNNIPSIINGEFKLIKTNTLRRPNGSVGTQGFTSENMIKLINYILKNKKIHHSLFEELIEDKDLDNQIVKTFKSKESLSNDIFTKSNKGFVMNDDVRKTLLKIADEFIDTLGIEFFIHDIILTGSLANYNWSKYSDVDLHILIDFKETDYDLGLLKEFFDAKKNIWNEKHEIKVKNFDVEIYVQDVNEEHVSSGVYSVLNNKWIIEPKKDDIQIDDKKIIEKGEEFAKKIDDLIQYSKSNKNILPEIENLRKKIKKFRQSGLDSGGEFSYENLTFKLLRRNGYIEKLLNLKTTLIDKKLSITQ